MKRIVTVRDSDGRVAGEWAGGVEQNLAPVSGYTHIDVTGSALPNYSGQRWTGSAFEPFVERVRVLSPIDFARRFTMAEESAIDTLADSNRTVKAWMRRLMLATTVNLDHADVTQGLAYLKSVGVPSVWADEADADARIAEIGR